MSRRRAAAAVLCLSGLLAACSSGEGSGSVQVTIAGQTTTLHPIMLCTDGKPKVLGDTDTVEPVEVASGERVRVSVSDDIAEKSWTIQVWSAVLTDGKLVPTRAIQVLQAGKASTYDKLTTSDSAPDSVYLFVATPPEKGCSDAGGLWPIALVRTS